MWNTYPEFVSSLFCEAPLCKPTHNRFLKLAAPSFPVSCRSRAISTKKLIETQNEIYETSGNFVLRLERLFSADHSLRLRMESCVDEYQVVVGDDIAEEVTVEQIPVVNLFVRECLLYKGTDNLKTRSHVTRAATT